MNGIYFSGSGNTKHCIEIFVQATGGKVASIESPDALELIKNSEEIAIGYPTHYSNLPRIMKEFILRNGNAFNGKKVFIIVTMGLFSGDGAGLGARLLKRFGAKILGGLHLQMPDSIGDVKMLKKPTEKNLAIIRQSEEKISSAVASISKGKYPKDGLFIWNRIAGLFGQRLWFIPTVKKLQTKLKIDSGKCVGCGICSERCPTKSISIQKGKAVFARGRCTICYRCVNHCPQRAITLIGKKVLEQCRYDLYEKELQARL